MINSKRIRKLVKDRKKKIFEYIAQTDKNVILKIFSEEIYEFLINESLNLSKNNKKNELKEILQYYQQYYPISKKDDINLINQFINNNKGDIEQYEKYLKDIDEAQKMNLKTPFIKILLENEEEISEEKIEQEKKSWINLENMIKKGKLNKNTRKDKKKFLFEIFQNQNYKDRLIAIFNEKIYNNFIIENNIKIIDNDKNNDKNNDNNNNVDKYPEKLKDEEKEKEKEKEKDKEKEKEKEIEKENKLFNTDVKAKESNNNFSNNKLIRVNDNDIKKVQNVQNNNLDINTKSTKIQSTQKKNGKNEKIIKGISSDATIPEIVSLKDLENKILIENMLIKSEIKFHTNKKGNSPFILYDEINVGKYKIKSIAKFEELKNHSNKELEKDNALYTKFKQFIEFLNEIETRLENEFELEYYLIIKLEIELYNINDLNNQDNLYCKYIAYLPDSKNEISFKEDNILTYKTYSLSQGFEYLISEINDENYKNVKYIEHIKKDLKVDNQNTFLSTTNNTNNNYENPNDKIEEDDTVFRFNQKETEDKNLNLKIIEFEEIIGNHKGCKNNYTCEFIKELKSGYFISGGTDKSIKIYTKEFKEFDLNDQLSELNNGIKDWTYSICERTQSNEKLDTIEFITCSNKELILITYDFIKKLSQIQKYELPNMTCVNCIEMKPYHFAIFGLDGGLFFPDLFKDENQGEVPHYIISQKTFRGGIRIKDNIVALTSNKVVLHGEDILIFYNSEKRNKNNPISHSIKGHSFTLTTNGLALMPKEKIGNKNQILICACTKYLPDQKNGILLVNPQFEDKKDVENPFYDTGDFEVYCICPIFKVIGQENIMETNFFLVGGFDNEKYEGKIQLYKVIYSHKAYETKIEYLQDIVFEINDNFGGFEGPISCITQSTYYGNILVSCYDGNVYKLSNPDLSFYENDRK